MTNVEDKSSICIEMKDWGFVLKWDERLNAFQPERIKKRVVFHVESSNSDLRIENTTIPSQIQENKSTSSTQLSVHYTIKLSSSFPQQSYSQSIIILQLFVL